MRRLGEPGAAEVGELLVEPGDHVVDEEGHVLAALPERAAT